MKEYRHKIQGVGAFFAGAVAATAALGYVFFVSKNGKRNRKKVEWWIEDAKDEVMTRATKIKNLTEDKFYDTIDTVMEKYARMKYATKDKIDEIREELRDHWEEIENDIEDEDE